MGIAISAILGSETTEPMELKFGMVDDVQNSTPYFKIDIRRFRGIGWGQRWICHIAWFFLNFFGASTEQSIEHFLTLSAPQNVFWW